MSKFAKQLEQLETFFSRFHVEDVALWKRGISLPIQINDFLSAYPSHVANTWRTGDLPTVTDTPLAQQYSDLTDDAKKFLEDEAKPLTTVVSCPSCGKPLHIAGVCPGCQKGKEGFKSKLYCKTPTCNYEEYLQKTVTELQGAI